MSENLPELDKSSWDQGYLPKPRRYKKADHRYVLIDCELVDVGNITDNLCPRCGMQNCCRHQ